MLNRKQCARLRAGDEVAARHVFHRDVRQLVADHRVGDRHDVRMHELADERGFILQLRANGLAAIGIAKKPAVDDLERNLALGKRIDREINNARGARAEPALKSVFADGAAHRNSGNAAAARALRETVFQYTMCVCEFLALR